MTDLRQATLEQQAEPVALAHSRHAKLMAKFTENAEAMKALAQAEPPPEWPLIKNILAVFGLDAIAFVAKWKAAQQQAEPVEERITHITWDERGVRTVNGIPDDAPRRKELSASEILNMMPSAIPAEYDGPLMEFARAVEAKSKENT